MEPASATHRLRRAAILSLSVAIVATATASILLAAAWRSAAAPLTNRPATAAQVADTLAAELDHSDALAAQLEAAHARIAELDRALATAGVRVSTDADQAVALRARLTEAQAKLDGVQGQLRAARHRLDALVAAAARARAATIAPAAAGAARLTEHEGEDDG